MLYDKPGRRSKSTAMEERLRADEDYWVPRGRRKDLSKPHATLRHTRRTPDPDEVAISELLAAGHGFSIADSDVELRDGCCITGCPDDNVTGDIGFCWEHWQEARRKKR